MRYLTGKHLSRRTLLRGTGAAIALPLLESMIPAGVRDASAAGVPRSRLACVYIPHGCVMSRWMPSSEGRDFELQPTLQSLEPFRERVNIVSGLKLQAAYVGESSAAANHSRSSQCWLTCMPEDTGPSPTSVDQVAARHVGQETPLPSLELALEAGSSISYLTPQTPLPAINVKVDIDGTTQSGGKVEISGTDSTGICLDLQGGGSSVRGLVINRFTGGDGVGIRIFGGAKNSIVGNYIGTDVSGNVPAFNVFNIVVTNSSNNEIGTTKPFMVFTNRPEIAIYIASSWTVQNVSIASVLYPDAPNSLATCIPSSGEGPAYAVDAPPIHPNWVYPFSVQ